MVVDVDVLDVDVLGMDDVGTLVGGEDVDDVIAVDVAIVESVGAVVDLAGVLLPADDVESELHADGTSAATATAPRMYRRNAIDKAYQCSVTTTPRSP